MHEPEFQRLYGEAMCRVDAAAALTLSATRLYVDQCRRWLESVRESSSDCRYRRRSIADHAAPLRRRRISCISDIASERE
jgi:hypothetical protein